MNLRGDIIKSLKLQYESEIQKAKTTVKIYLSNSVGIGEHPQHLDEIDKQIEIISNNEDKLNSLNKYFKLTTININCNGNVSGNVSSNVNVNLSGTYSNNVNDNVDTNYNYSDCGVFSN